MMWVSGKGQSAMEYLMTYGWAILIIAVVLGALFQLGVFNATNFAPRVPAGACQVERLSTQVALAGECQGGLPQYVAQFTNGAGRNQYIDLGTGATQTGAMTLVLWFYVSSCPASTQDLYGNQGPVWNAESYIIFLGTSCNVGWDFNSNAHYYNVQYTTTPGAWHFMAATFDGGNTITMQIDNNPVQRYTAASNFYTVAQGHSVLAQGSGDGYFSGDMANFQVYNTSLSSSEVNALYLEGVGGAPIDVHNVVGWWPLNGNENDYGGLGNNGQAYNGVSFTGSYLSRYTTP